ncbi:putative inactive purple acid phosphatase 28 [Camellia lanceoleosa]|uniref:Inactive purple acid phosphatase 28 n=1 Tax=Camellia lanceoleosa TaxID=1840588 RepID=A0ACC0IH10_9ERIC|nr:putative inactive purple acid phosphatase 28 [Camellia lanceoleosa]
MFLGRGTLRGVLHWLSPAQFCMSPTYVGDNIFGTSSPDAAESMFEAFGPVMESRLPWAAVLGNHDQESTMTRVELMSFISLMDYSVSQTNPLAEETSDPAKESLVRDIDGFGNYNLRSNCWRSSNLWMD